MHTKCPDDYYDARQRGGFSRIHVRVSAVSESRLRAGVSDVGDDSRAVPTAKQKKKKEHDVPQETIIDMLPPLVSLPLISGIGNRNR